MFISILLLVSTVLFISSFSSFSSAAIAKHAGPGAVRLAHVGCTSHTYTRWMTHRNFSPGTTTEVSVGSERKSWNVGFLLKVGRWRRHKTKKQLLRLQTSERKEARDEQREDQARDCWECQSRSRKYTGPLATTLIR